MSSSAAGPGDCAVAVAGESLVLMPERVAHWPRRDTLLVADPHFGKAATFRAGGIPVPRGTTSDGLARLDALLHRTAARRIVFLGDFLHAKEGRAPETLRALATWRATHANVEMVLVRGNHDRRAGDPPADVGVACLDAPVVDSPFVFAHYPRPSHEGFVVGGHVHQSARLAGAGGLRARLPCFVIGPDVAVLPAFGDFTGLGDIEIGEGTRVVVVADDRLVDVTA